MASAENMIWERYFLCGAWSGYRDFISLSGLSAGNQLKHGNKPVVSNLLFAIVHVLKYKALSGLDMLWQVNPASKNSIRIHEGIYTYAQKRRPGWYRNPNLGRSWGSNCCQEASGACSHLFIFRIRWPMCLKSNVKDWF